MVRSRSPVRPEPRPGSGRADQSVSRPSPAGKAMVCFGSMFIELPAAQTRDMLRKGTVTANGGRSLTLCSRTPPSTPGQVLAVARFSWLTHLGTKAGVSPQHPQAGGKEPTPVLGALPKAQPPAQSPPHPHPTSPPGEGLLTRGNGFNLPHGI